MGKIEAICISEKKGTVKRPVEEALLVEEFGIRGDAHAGKWHRQVSILGYEKIKEFTSREERWRTETLGKTLSYPESMWTVLLWAIVSWQVR
ncbi:hypothetical protein [Anaerostipes caccae]|uniref:hypothetical protein n=1 Tax=Anaerostipes caccae TaxID=105841 RepID=UPI0002E13944|nr:hypothetical protein [Anaerostipes caccae]